MMTVLIRVIQTYDVCWELNMFCIARTATELTELKLDFIDISHLYERFDI